ncbi:MAG: lytic transglycosylase domain-containing protein [Actinobacteria bacterium]|nr:lytic transglycosylase domain-containing protein [Actinomycetota bacterium]
MSACQPPDFAISVPDAYKSYFEVAAKRCPGVLTPEGLAAQASTESGFDPGAVSPAGAQGLMQIIPDVWSVYGTDADGDGRADPFTAADSVATSARFNCYLSRELESMRSDQTELRLAAYNAGLGAVQRYQGIPPYKETENYVQRVASRTQAFADDFVSPSA